jgi:hypothetical protein
MRNNNRAHHQRKNEEDQADNAAPPVAYTSCEENEAPKHHRSDFHDQRFGSWRPAQNFLCLWWGTADPSDMGRGTGPRTPLCAMVLTKAKRMTVKGRRADLDRL